MEVSTQIHGLAAIPSVPIE